LRKPTELQEIGRPGGKVTFTVKTVDGRLSDQASPTETMPARSAADPEFNFFCCTTRSHVRVVSTPTPAAVVDICSTA